MTLFLEEGAVILGSDGDFISVCKINWKNCRVGRHLRWIQRINGASRLLEHRSSDERVPGKSWRMLVRFQSEHNGMQEEESVSAQL
ncbi:uncharacterized protein LOC144707477 isoform X4 [Wolffia australiana]